MSTASTNQDTQGLGASEKATYRERPTLTISLPPGWARSALAGVEAAILGWLVPTLLFAVAFLLEASNPWLREQTIGGASRAGTEFWATTLGASATFGDLNVSLVPLTWTLVQLVLYRALLLTGRNFGSAALWMSLPFYLLTVAIILLATGAQVNIWWSLLGALLLGLFAVGWGVARQTREFPRWAKRQRWIWAGVRTALLWLAVTVGVSLIAFIATLSTSWQGVLESTAMLGLDTVGNFGLGLLQAMYLPLFLACALAWMAGTGFTVLTGVVVGASTPITADIPVYLPIISTIPITAPGVWVTLLLALLGMLLGVLLSVTTARLTLADSARRGGVAFVVFALLLLLWMQTSRGSLGAGMLAELGPTPFTWLALTGLIGGIALTFGLALHPETRRYVAEGFGRVRESRLDATADAVEVAVVADPVEEDEEAVEDEVVDEVEVEANPEDTAVADGARMQLGRRFRAALGGTSKEGSGD